MDQQEAKRSRPLERVIVQVTNTISTAIGFRRSSPPPWEDGNYLTFHFRKASVPGQVEEWVSWGVVNMHSENSFEITRRLETAVEKCGGVMCVTGRSKTAASSITMKDVRRYGKLERDTQASIGGGSKSTADSP
jgi:hypothetical protein